MANRKYEFRPDKTHGDLLNKLYLTKKQRLSLLKWSLFAVTLLALSVVQDVILCRVTLFGAACDLVPCAIFMICVILGAETGSVFSLVAAAMYQFSGTAPGYHIIVMIPLLGICAALFRQSYLRRSFSAEVLCAGSATLLYETALYVIGVATGYTAIFRVVSFLITAGLSLIVNMALYPLYCVIGRIGGEPWKE